MNIVKMKISDLKQDESNVREHNTKNLETVKISLQNFGQYKPLIVQQSTMSVLVGNARLTQMKELGWDHAECVLINIPDDRAELLKIADNRTSDLSSWDYAKLLKQIELMPDDISSFIGFDDEDVEDLKKISKQKITLKAKMITCPYCSHEFIATGE